MRVLLKATTNLDRACTDEYADMRERCLDVCHLLLDWGAKVDPVNKFEALHCTSRGHIQGICRGEVVLEFGAVVTRKDVDGASGAARRKQGHGRMVTGWVIFKKR